MEISKASVTAIHGLVYLANVGEKSPLDVSEIAEKLGFQKGYLAKTFQRLARARLVYSRRGPQGGYVLASDPSNIALIDVIEAMEGPVITDQCDLSPDARCNLYDTCKIRKKLNKIREQTRQLYEDVTLDMFDQQFKDI